MTFYEDTIEVTGKGSVAVESGLSVAVEVTGKGALAVEPGGLLLQDLIEFTGTGHIFAGPYIDWSYRRGVKITNYTGSGLTEYPVEVVLTSEDFDYGKCRTDGGDIRFSSANVALSYWIEDWNYNGTSRIWVKASSIPEGFEVCLHIHYGKLDEVSESNGANVWNVEFDHFLGDTLDPTKWESFGSPTGSLSITVQDGYVKVYSSSYNSKQVGMKSINDSLIGSTYRILMRMKAPYNYGGSHYGFWNALGQISDVSNLNAVYFWSGIYVGQHYTRHASRAAGTWSFAEYQQGDYSVWRRYLNKKIGTSHHKGKQDDELELELTSNVFSGNAPFRIFHIHDNYYTTVQETHLDFVAITDKYASPDPIASLVSEEEEEEKSLIFKWTLFQSAEIAGAGAVSLAPAFQPMLEIAGAGAISLVSDGATYHDSFEAAGAGAFLPPHSYIFVDLANYPLGSFIISKTIQDPYWKFKGDIEGLSVPDYFKTLRIILPDHEDLPHCIFLGFIPGAGFSLVVAEDTSVLNGFDQAWYLEAQYVPVSLRVIDENTNPASTITALLGGANWTSVTGIEPHCIHSVADWASIKQPFIFNSKMTKWKAIQEICAVCHHVFLVKWRKTDDDQYYSCAYFVHEDDADFDTHLELPALATINNPDDHLLSRVKKAEGGTKEYPVLIEEAEMEKYNRIIVSGIDIETGTWYHRTLQSPGVTSGEELPIEYIYESALLDSQDKVDALALALYNFYHTTAKYYIATFDSRTDFELYQKIKFVGFDSIPDELMRITGLTFDRQVTHNIVTILFCPDQQLSDLRKLLRSMGRRDYFDWTDLTKIVVGTVQEISDSGKTALVKIDKDETIVRARLLYP